MEVAKDYSYIWNTVINQLTEGTEEQEFNWWANLTLLKATDTEFFIEAPSSFIKDQIKERYTSVIESELSSILCSPVKISLSIREKGINIQKNIEFEETPRRETSNAVVSSQKAQIIYQNKVQSTKKQHNQLKKDYNFENYIIGDNNRHAVNAALSAAKNLGTSYNPLLIYGGVGLGKTHLMQAIGNYVCKNSDSKIIFVTAENFVNEFIESISNNSMTDFRNKYRRADLLLIDDIHSISKRAEASIEELFHTYEALYNSNKQMVFTCDRPPLELKNITERLKSRFGSGVNVDLQVPDYETRCAILKSKIKIKGISISDDVISLVSKNITTNIRDLEAALKKLFLYNDLENRPITLEIAQNQLKDIFASPRQSNISMEIVQRVVAENFNLSPSDLKSKKRSQNLSHPRHIAMFIIQELTEFSTTEIGRAFGDRDHSTVTVAINKLQKKLKDNPSEEATIRSLERIVKEQSVK